MLPCRGQPMQKKERGLLLLLLSFFSVNPCTTIFYTPKDMLKYLASEERPIYIYYIYFILSLFL